MREMAVALCELCGSVENVRVSSHTGVTESHRVQFRQHRRLQSSVLLLSRLRNEVPHSLGSHIHTHSWTWLFTGHRDRLISAMGCRDTVAHMNGQKENSLHKGKVRMQSQCQSTWLTALFRLLKNLKVKLTRGKKKTSQTSTQTQRVLWEGHGTYESQWSVQRDAISSVENTQSKHLVG